MTTPDEVYRAVAEERCTRWGYRLTLDPDEQDKYIRSQSEDSNLRADADVVWAQAMLHLGKQAQQ